MIKLFKNASQIVSVDTEGKNVKRGLDANNLTTIENHSIVIENEILKDFIPNSKIFSLNFDDEIDIADKIILPGLVECHTHTAFTGSRANEFRMKLKGKSYEEIAEAGGGINATVKAVRNASFEELLKTLQQVGLFYNR